MSMFYYVYNYISGLAYLTVVINVLWVRWSELCENVLTAGGKVHRGPVSIIELLPQIVNYCPITVFYSFTVLYHNICLSLCFES